MNADFIRISDEEAKLQYDVTEIALGVLRNAGGSSLVDTLGNALESGNFEEMRALKQVFEALPERMRASLLWGFGRPEEAQYAARLVEEVLHDLPRGERFIIC